MKVRFYLILIAGLLGSLSLAGCQSQDSPVTATFKTSPSGEHLRLSRVSASDPEKIKGIESILVDIRTTDVDTQTFGNLFNVSHNYKLVKKEDFDKDILIAIKPGTLDVRVFAFPKVLSEEGDASSYEAEYNASTKFGKTSQVKVAVGEEKTVRVKMYPAKNITFSNMTVNRGSVDFTTSNLPKIPAKALYNAESPDFLNFATQHSKKQKKDIEGTQHSIQFSSSDKVKPFFVKVEIEHQTGGVYYRGSSPIEFCEESCGDIPLVVYDRKISLNNDKDPSEGVTQYWKTTTNSEATGYFSKDYFDQRFILQQENTATSLKLKDFGIYEVASTKNCDAKAPCEMDFTTASNAPSGFFTDLSTLFNAPIIKKQATTGTYYSSKTDCAEQLNRLGQDCANVPRVDKFSIRGNGLYLEVASGSEGSRFEIYKGNNLEKETETETLKFSASGNGMVESQGIVYTGLKDSNFFGRLVSGSGDNELKGNWLALNRSSWNAPQGRIDSATNLAIDSPVEGNLVAGSDIYYKLPLQAKRYEITVEGDKGAMNLWEIYIIGINGNKPVIVDSVLGYNLLTGEIPQKTTIPLNPKNQGDFYLKIANPLGSPMAYKVSYGFPPK